MFLIPQNTASRITPIADYNIFHPGQLNVEQRVIAARDAGARFALLTATHKTGFALFQPEVNPYSMNALWWKDGKGDIVKLFVETCRKHGIKPGIYLGIRWNSFFGVHDFKVNGQGPVQKKWQAYCNAMMEGMVREICTNYGPLFKIWFDAGCQPPGKGSAPHCQEVSTRLLFTITIKLAEARWGGSETGTVGYPCWSTFPHPSTGAGKTSVKMVLLYLNMAMLPVTTGYLPWLMPL